MSRNEPNEYRFTIREAYRLGDKFRNKGELIAAEACYAFAEMKPLPMPIPNDSPVDPNRLTQLIQHIKKTNYKIPKKSKGKGKDIPQDCLKLIQAFYDPWLQQIKPDMKERSDEHAQRRMKGVIEVFKAVTGDRLGQLILDDIARANHNQQIDKIDAWNGPSFGKFQIRDNQKMKNNFSLSRLTVVLDFKNYRKRCRNSQEDWFKAIDGRFFAQCLNKAYQMFVDKFSDNKERQYIGIIFIKAVLDKYIQFPSASAKLLVPAGTIFANPELMETIHRFHPAINPLGIKQQARSRAVRVLHKRLMQDVNTEYDKICGSMENPLLSLPKSPALPPKVNMVQDIPSSSFNSEHEDDNDQDQDQAETNDDGFLQMINADDIEMNGINNNTNTANMMMQNGSRPRFENNYSFNGSQSDGSSSFVHNGSSSGQSDEEDGNWRSSVNVPYPVMVQFPPLTNTENSRVVTNLVPKITNPFSGISTMEQQQQHQQQQQMPSFQLNQVPQEPAHPTLPELPANLNMTLFMNIPEKNQENINQKIDEQKNVNMNINNINNGNDEVMTQINGTNMVSPQSRARWDDGMTQIGITDMMTSNPNQSMMPFMNDDNQTTFQPMTVIMDPPQTTTCPSQCTCHLNNNDNQSYHHHQNYHQESLPPVPSQHNINNTISCDYEFNTNNCTPSHNPQLNMNSMNSYTSSVISGDTHSVGTGAGSRYSSVAPGFMNSNAPYKTIQIQQQPPSQTQSQYLTIPQQQYSSRGSSPTTDYGYTPSHDIPNDINNNAFQDVSISNNNIPIGMNAFDDTFEIDDPNPMSMTKDMCMGCYESVSQCKCNSIAMNKRYKSQFQNTNTFNTRNNRIHHQNMQSMINLNNNDRIHRRQLHIEQLNNIRIREMNNNQIYNNNYNYNNNNNWNTSMNAMASY